MTAQNETGETQPGASPRSVGEEIAELEHRHSVLEQELAEEEIRPHPDSATISTLKRQKLAIKDRIAALQAR